MQENKNNYVLIEVTPLNSEKHLKILLNMSRLIETTLKNNNVLGKNLLKMLNSGIVNDYHLFYNNKQYPKKHVNKFILEKNIYSIKNINVMNCYENTRDKQYAELALIKVLQVTNYKEFMDTLKRKYSPSHVTLPNRKVINNYYIIDNYLVLPSIKTLSYIDYGRDLYTTNKYIVINPTLITLHKHMQKTYKDTFKYNIEVMPIEDCFKFISLQKNTLKRHLQKILKMPKKDIVLLGVGGVGNSFLYWLDKILKYFEIDEKIFNKLILVDGDILEYHNIYRLPLYSDDIELNANQTISKVDLILKSYTENIISNEIISYNKHIATNEDFLQIIQNLDTPIIYGAPTIETRCLLDTIKKEMHDKFDLVYSLNQNNTATLEWNTSYNEDLTLANETYGELDITCFLLNQLAICCKFLEQLANNNHENFKVQTINFDISHKNIKKQINNRMYIL